MSLKKILLIIAVVDLVLATIAYFVVFYNTPGTYTVANSPLPATTLPTSTLGFGSSTPSSTIPTSTASVNSPTASSTPTGNPSQSIYGSDFTPPYPLSWTEGNASLSIMGAELQGNQLIFKLAVAMGNAMACVPLNVRMLIDEEGHLAAPITQQFTFPESDSCNGAPGATYTDQQVVFNVDPTTMPIFFTTGGASNIFFSVATSTDGGLSITRPSASGD